MTLEVNPSGDEPRKLSQALNQALRGKLNSTGSVTLAGNVTSTTVANVFVGSASVILTQPQTANAAGEIGNGTMYIAPANYVQGASFKITHANNAQSDRTFGYVVIG